MFYILIEEMVSLSIIMNTTLIFPFVSGMKILWIIIKEEEICFLMIYPIHKIRSKVIIFLSNTKLLFENKKELSPKILYENGINVIIRLYNISKELKLKLLLDTNIKNNEIEQIKSVLESNNIKRRKITNNIKYRPDHILSKLVNIINLFMNKLINALFTNEKLNQILTELILLKNISNKDLKEVIKKSDYVFRYQLTKNNEKLNLLNFTLKEYFSVKISSKYNKLKYPSNYNQLILEKLLKDETNKNIFDFILNGLFIKIGMKYFYIKKI